MQRVTANSDGSIGPFGDTAVAEEWITARLGLLCALASQKGTPTVDVLTVAVPTDPWHPCTSPAVYDSRTDTVRMHYAPGKDDVLDLGAVDGMLLHALGHRARRSHTRTLRRVGWTLVSAGLTVACVAAFRDGFRDGFDSPLLGILCVIGAIGAFYGGVAARSYWRAEADADDYALLYGGPRPILTFLRRMSGDPVAEFTISRARPGRRITRIQSRLWGDSILLTHDASLPPIADPTAPDDPT